VIHDDLRGLDGGRGHATDADRNQNEKRDGDEEFEEGEG